MINTKVLIVLGKGFIWHGKEPVKPPKLTIFSELSVIAAMVLANQKKYDAIVFSGGVTIPGEISEARAMANYFANICGDNNKDIIILCEENSLSTFDSAHNLKKFFELHGYIYQIADVLSVGFHMVRVKSIFKHHLYTNTTYLSAEGVLHGCNNAFKYAPYLVRQNKKLYYREYFKELLLRIINQIDPNNRITQYVIRKFGRSELI